MEKRAFEEEKHRLLAILERQAPAFKYELTRQHFSEDQIEAIFPIIMKYMDKALQEYFTTRQRVES